MPVNEVPRCQGLTVKSPPSSTFLKLARKLGEEMRPSMARLVMASASLVVVGDVFDDDDRLPLAGGGARLRVERIERGVRGIGDAAPVAAGDLGHPRGIGGDVARGDDVVVAAGVAADGDEVGAAGIER